MKNLGLILIILGAVLLIVCVLPVPFLNNLADYNIYTFGSVFLIIRGLIAHIILNKIFVD